MAPPHGHNIHMEEHFVSCGSTCTNTFVDILYHSKESFSATPPKCCQVLPAGQTVCLQLLWSTLPVKLNSPGTRYKLFIFKSIHSLKCISNLGSQGGIPAKTECNFDRSPVYQRGHIRTYSWSTVTIDLTCMYVGASLKFCRVPCRLRKNMQTKHRRDSNPGLCCCAPLIFS